MLLVLVTVAWHASAAPGVLVVVRNNGAVDPTPYELRLRSELRTEGIEAVVASAGAADSDTKSLVARMGVTGVIEVGLADAEATASVWVFEPQLNIEIARSIRVSLTQRDAVSVFALRAVDLFVGAKMELEQQRKLRDKSQATDGLPNATNSSTSAPLSESTGTAPSKPKTAAAKPKALADEKSPNVKAVPGEGLEAPAPREKPERARVERFRVGAAIALMKFTDKLSFRLAPSLSGTYALNHSIAVGLTVTGPYVATIFKNTATPNGVVESNQARIDQEFFWIDGRYRIRLGDTFDLEPAIGGGLARYAVDGVVQSAAYKESNPSAWSVITTLGGTLVWRVSPKVRLMADVVCVARWATPRVIMDGQDETGKSALSFWGSVGPAWVF